MRSRDVSSNTVHLVNAGTGQEEGGGQNARATGGPGLLPRASNEKTSAKFIVLDVSSCSENQEPCWRTRRPPSLSPHVTPRPPRSAARVLALDGKMRTTDF